VLLQLRVYAIYEKSKALLAVFCVLDTLALSIFVFLEVTSNDGINADALNLQKLYSNAGYAPLSWIPGIIVETTTFGLVVYKIRKNRDALRHDRVKQATLLELIIRGNVFYFLIILLVYLIGACLSLSKFALFWNGHYVASVSICGIIASRLFIALRKDFLKQLELTGVPSISTTFFALPGDSV
ncbi:hypothetical protein DFH11DRAFT_1507731, partial [Phellopilus nigrolimitatus]